MDGKIDRTSLLEITDTACYKWTWIKEVSCRAVLGGMWLYLHSAVFQGYKITLTYEKAQPIIEQIGPNCCELTESLSSVNFWWTERVIQANHDHCCTNLPYIFYIIQLNFVLQCRRLMELSSPKVGKTTGIIIIISYRKRVRHSRGRHQLYTRFFHYV